MLLLYRETQNVLFWFWDKKKNFAETIAI